jgi:glycine cleavage system H protein
MSDIKYTKEHEVIAVDGDVISIGVTDYAKDALGDLVFIELPEAGRKVEKDEEFAVVESVKIASEIYSPLAGEIVEVNEALEDEVDDLKKEVKDGGWIAKIKVNDKSEIDSLMSEEEYKSYIQDLD